MTSRIVLYHRGIPVVRQRFDKPVISVGTHPESDLQLAGGVAERHMVVCRDADGSWRARPAGAAEGGTELAPGTRVALGPYALELDADEVTASDAPAGSEPPGGDLDTDGEPGADDLGLVGASTQMRLLRMDVLRIAPLKAPVLVTGETGTGKELVARAVHARSGRASGPFVAVNCGALTASLVQDTLFGHERGAFTGAGSSHRGVFEQAAGGTLFLDEIGELPLPQQASLLRVLDDGAVRRIGAESSERVSFRLVSATNRDLSAMVDEGDLRADLYHRIAALCVETPALRDRPEDIGPLARHFLAGMADDVGAKELEDAAIESLAGHAWEGNARELRNVLYRAAASVPGRLIGASDLELCPARRAVRRNPFRLDRVPDCRIEEIVRRHSGNVAAAAREIGVSRSTLRDRRRRLADGCR